MKSILKLGTRKSLLAWAQSSWVARQLENLNPGLRVELFGIETQGDKILDISLRNVEGKEFFVAEIDEALRSRKVDLTVHSMKDLSLERPSELVCAAIPERENPRDVVLFGPHALDRLKSGKPLKIGTSSPRRLENVPLFLEKALPRIAPSSDDRPRMEFIEIRGNVNTRLSRVKEPPFSPRYLDGVVLAFAGLIRLWNDTSGRQELSHLLEGVRWMVLPLKECPSAPGQGALSIECRADDKSVLALVEKLNHPPTVSSVAEERSLLCEWGGGCHQRFGATAIDFSKDLGRLLYIRGKKSDGSKVEELRWGGGPKESFGFSDLVHPWDGTKWKASARPLSLTEYPHEFQGDKILKGGAVFVAHSRAVQALNPQRFQEIRVWTSGTASWFKLAEQGIWVEGCAEGLGFDRLLPILGERVLQLPELCEWIVLTHSKARNEWADYQIKTFPTYEINFKYLKDAKSAMQGATHLFWSSGSQYDELKEWVSQRTHRNAQHACGPGKTATYLRKQGLFPIVFPSAEEWRQWIQDHP